MRFTSIASSSGGNVSYIGTDNTHLLIDAGITMKAIGEGLHTLELDFPDISGIFITHEHIDHIQAVGTIARKYGIPIYGTLGTLQGILLKRSLGSVPKALLHPIYPDTPVTLGELTVLPFSVYHDAADPVGYRVSDGKRAAAVATDMGHFDDYIVSHLTGLDAVLLEANHDEEMLAQGPYPMALKRRILSDNGHLSNTNAGRLLNAILDTQVRHVFLGHLSKENNLPELALETVRNAVNSAESPFSADDLGITVADRDRISEILAL